MKVSKVPEIGQIVHYTLKNGSEILPAIVLEAWEARLSRKNGDVALAYCNLEVFGLDPQGSNGQERFPRDVQECECDEPRGGCWSWPPRARHDIL